jgi:hypothetical protein
MIDPPACCRYGVHGIVVLTPAAAADPQNEVG